MTILFYSIIDMLSIIFMNIASKYNENTSRRLSLYNSKKNRLSISGMCFYMSFLILFIVAALRYGIGADYWVYAYAYTNIGHDNLSPVDEAWLGLGFVTLCKLIYWLYPGNTELMFAIMSFLTLMFFFLSIYKNSKNWTVSITIFIASCLYYQTFNQMRQMLAISIIAYAYVYLQDKKLIHFVLWVFIASMIHFSAIVVLILLPIVKIKFKIKYAIFYMFLGICMGMGIDIIFDYLKEYFFYGNTYIGSDKYDTSFDTSTIINAVIRFILSIVCLCAYSDNDTENISVFYHMIFICNIFQILTMHSHLFGRVTTYFFISYIFLIPYIIENIKNVYIKRRTKIVLYLCLIIYHYAYYYLGGADSAGYSIYYNLLFDA